MSYSPAFFQFRHGKERLKSQVRPGKIGRTARFAVNNADDFGQLRVFPAQGFRRIEDRAAGSDDILDDEQFAPLHGATLGDLARAIILRLFADEKEGQAGQLREHRGNGDAAHFEARQCIDFLGHQFAQGNGDMLEQVGIGFKKIFVEILAALRARTQREVARDVGRIVDSFGERRVVGHDQFLTCAMTSISTRTPSGSAATCTVERTG